MIGEGIIYKDSKGRWTVAIELPRRDKARRRKVVRVKTETEAKRELRRQMNDLEKFGDLETESITLEEWIEIWFATIAVPKIRPKTAQTYRGIIDREILPAIGDIKMDKLTPTDVREMNTRIVKKGLVTTAAQAYRILSVALKYAEQEGKATRNVAAMVDPPKQPKAQLEVLTVEQAKQVLRAATGTPLESLWYSILLTGARQGELLGLETNRVSHVLEVSWQLQRLTWEHGCGGTCNRKRGSDCRSRRISAPVDWENRHLVGGLWLSRPKSNAGLRIVPMIPALRKSVEAHIISCTYPNPYGLVWRMKDGSPIDPRWENEAWHELLADAGIEDRDPSTGNIIKKVRLHDARHTTVDLLYEAGIPEDLIQAIVGHSTRAMTRSYKSAENDKRLASAMLQLADLMNEPQDQVSLEQLSR